MRCCARLRNFLFVLAFGLTGLWSMTADAAGIEVQQMSLQGHDDGYELSADFALDFPPALEDAVARGLTLYFVAEFELLRPRWYWFDERAVRRTQTWRLSYHALTRQYRLSTGALHQNFPSLDDALRVLARIRHWQVFERKEIKVGESYQALIRLYLDLSQLPKPFQLNALANREWDLSSPWLNLDFVPSPAATEAR